MSGQKRRASKNSKPRSATFTKVAYFLARRGLAVDGGYPRPPTVLEVRTWNAAYDLFHGVAGDGRSPGAHRNSMKNCRDVFDRVLDNGRSGWKRHATDPMLGLGAAERQIYELCRDESDENLDSWAITLIQAGVEAGRVQQAEGEARTEGGVTVFESRRYERDPVLRQAALDIHGTRCMVCGFDFEARYGELGAGFIEVHHVVPLSERGRSVTNPGMDLTVLCSNCHRMVHRVQGICPSLDELRSRLVGQ